MTEVDDIIFRDAVMGAMKNGTVPVERNRHTIA